MLHDFITIDRRLVGGTKAYPVPLLIGPHWVSNGHWAIQRTYVKNMDEVLRWLARRRTPWGGEIYNDGRGDGEFVARIKHGRRLGAVTLTGWTLRVNGGDAKTDNWRPQPAAVYSHLRGRDVGSFLVLSRYIKAFSTKRWTVFSSASTGWGRTNRYVLADYPESTSVFVLPVMAGQGSNQWQDQSPPVSSDIKIGPQPSMFGGRREIDLRGEER